MTVDLKELAETTLAASEGGSGSDPAPELTRGLAVGRYVVLSRLGAGAMGVVYAAYDPELDRKVAVKVLLPRFGERGASAARLRREALALAKLSHPNVVAVHDVGIVDERLFVAMEFVQGQTVTEWLAERQRSWREVLRVFVQAGQGLAAAHAQGLLHRDVKPDNMMIDAGSPGASRIGGSLDVRVRVMDFGLALPFVADPLEVSDPMEDAHLMSRSGEAGVEKVTLPGAVVGTPAYMAPEQFEGGALDERTDQFSFCVALWEALYGERPFAGDNVGALCVAVTHGERRPLPPGRSVPAWLRKVVERGLNVDPDDRWPSMGALLSALSRDRARRRVRWVAAGSVLTLGAATGVMWWRHDAQLCSGAAAELAEVWNDERRAEVRDGLLGADVPYAAQAWDHAAPKLQAWADDWVQMHTETCEATQRTGEQSVAVMDLRIGCLNRARQGFDAVATVLSEATPEVVERAHEVVADLPRIASCAHVGALQVGVPEPGADEAEAVAEVRSALADARVRRTAGNYDRALASAQQAQAMAEGLRYEPVRTEIELELGLVRGDRGEYDEAEAALRRACRLGAQWNQRGAMRAATTRLMFVLSKGQERHAEALALRDAAEGLAVGVPEHEAETHNSIATALQAQGKYTDAEREYRTALDLVRKALGDNDPQVAAVYHNLAGVLTAQGKHAEAELENRAALEAWRATVGVDHPFTAKARTGLALVLHAQGKHVEAEAEQRAALAIWQKALRPGHPDIAAAHNNLGAFLLGQGRLTEAESEHRTALAMHIELLGEGHPNVAASHNNLASVLGRQGKYAEAQAEQRAALAIWRETLGEEHPNVVTARNNLAGFLRAQGMYGEAESEYRAALELRKKVLGADHPLVGLSQNNLAEALRVQGKFAEAEVEHRAALAVLVASQGPDHPDVAMSRNNLGVVLHARGMLSEAESELRTALARWEETLGADHPNVGRARVNLAVTLLARNKSAEALELLEGVWAGHKRTPLPDPQAAKTAFALARAVWATGGERDRARALARQAAELYRQAETPVAGEQRDVEQWLRDHAAQR